MFFQLMYKYIANLAIQRREDISESQGYLALHHLPPARSIAQQSDGG